MPSSDNVSTKLQRIAKLAKGAPDMAFTSLSHHIDLDWMREAYRRTRKDGAKGVDGQGADEFAADLVLTGPPDEGIAGAIAHAG